MKQRSFRVDHKRSAFYVCAAVLVLATFEAGAAILTRVLVHQGWMAWIPTASQRRVTYYVTQHNPTLGWGPPVDAHGDVLQLVPRGDPAFDPREPSCVSAYGESFTAGSEVGDDATYPHYLGLRLGCRVANYGISGFGTDQALMLVRAQRTVDLSPIVVLGHVSEDIMRNVNQYRDLLYPGDDQELYFKPSFVLRAGKLRDVPIPVSTEADFRAFERDPDPFLESDAFRTRPRRQFPYSWSLARWVFSDFHVRAHLSNVPRYAAFYASNHPSHALQLTVAILRAFAAETRARGRQPFVLLVPIGRDFLYHRRTGKWVDQSLADELKQDGVVVIHAGPLMAARLGAADPCGLFRDCFRHFNARGYELLAAVASDAIQRARMRHAP